jgi:hypothetical protein
VLAFAFVTQAASALDLPCHTYPRPEEERRVRAKEMFSDPKLFIIEGTLVRGSPRDLANQQGIPFYSRFRKNGALDERSNALAAKLRDGRVLRGGDLALLPSAYVQTIYVNGSPSMRGADQLPAEDRVILQATFRASNRTFEIKPVCPTNGRIVGCQYGCQEIIEEFRRLYP